jgi:hypothetical protein
MPEQLIRLKKSSCDAPALFPSFFPILLHKQHGSKAARWGKRSSSLSPSLWETFPEVETIERAAAKAE